jgi:hypothetical protein
MKYRGMELTKYFIHRNPHCSIISFQDSKFTAYFIKCLQIAEHATERVNYSTYFNFSELHRLTVSLSISRHICSEEYHTYYSDMS